MKHPAAGHRGPRSFELDIIGATPRMRRLLHLIEKIAPTDATVLITGESGTGKELAARAIHQLSPRAAEVFLPVNAGAFPEHLIESELFGHVKGAFTGADRERRGLFVEANGGTLFLDEVAEMSPHLQVRLLRVLQTGEVRSVGGTEVRRVDVRIIAATNRDPIEAVRKGTLREDLYYRLNVFHLELPPLRERREDIPILASYFADRVSRDLGKEVTRFAPDAQVALMRYDYPGNVRELENAIQRAVVLADGDAITLENLPPVFSAGKGAFLLPARRADTASPTGGEEADDGGAGRHGFDVGYPSEWSLSDVERAHIAQVLADLNGNVSMTARRLGISRTTLWRKMKQHGISAQRSG